MLSVTIIAVGSVKEKYLADACREYIKRLSAFCRLNIVEVSEHKQNRNPSGAEITKCIDAEGEAIIQKLPSKALIIPLCIEGEQLSSQELSVKIEKITAESSHIVFIIGGSHGLGDSVKSRAGFKLSMSQMTFPHQLARVMLLEQIYRAFSILGGMRYHK